MIWLWLLLAVAGIYIALFVATIYVVPFFLPWKVPKRLPKEFTEAITQLEKHAKDPYEYLVACKDYLLSQNTGARFETFKNARLAFEDDLRTLFARRGFMHCHHFTALLYVLLVRSKFFSESEVKTQLSFLNFVPHSFLRAKISGQWYDADLHEVSLGMPLGKHGFGFSKVGFNR